MKQVANEVRGAICSCEFDGGENESRIFLFTMPKAEARHIEAASPNRANKQHRLTNK